MIANVSIITIIYKHLEKVIASLNWKLDRVGLLFKFLQFLSYKVNCVLPYCSFFYQRSHVI